MPADKMSDGSYIITVVVDGGETANNAIYSIVFTKTTKGNETNEINITNKTTNNPLAAATMKNTGIPITILLTLLASIVLVIRKKE